MALYEVKSDGLAPLDPTTLAAAQLRERHDLQRLLRDQIEVLGEDLLVISEEFSNWDTSRRRIDLLAVDQQANLVVIELKRDDTSGFVELQALRYAAMVSTLTFEKAVEAFEAYFRHRGLEDNATDSLLGFLDWDEPDEEVFAQDVRILLVASDFGIELTTAVLWLNQHDLDIKCIRLQPYTDGERLFVNVEQVIPLPEAEDFQVKIGEKARSERRTRRANRDLTKYDLRCAGRHFQNLPKRLAIFEVIRILVAMGHSPKSIAEADLGRPYERIWRVVEGEVGEEEFNRLARELRKAQGKRGHAPGRWYAEEDELMHVDGRTYALTNQWGGENWLRAMRNLQEAFPETEIEFAPAHPREEGAEG